MTPTLIEKAWMVAEVTVWSMERRVIACQTRINDAEGMYSRGTGTLEKVAMYAEALGQTQADLDDMREVIDAFNVTLEESGLSEKEYDKRQRELARKIIGYNKTYRPS